jgi:signal transduction histidine kinase
MVIFLVLIPTKFNYISAEPGFNKPYEFGPVYIYMAAYGLITLIWSGVIFFKTYWQTRKIPRVGTQNFIIFSGSFAYLLGIITSTNIIPDFPIYGVALVNFAPLAAFLFVIPLAYAILRYQAFNARVVRTEVITFILWLLLVFRYLFAYTLFDKVTDIGAFIIAFVLGIALIVSAIREIDRKNNLERLGKEIEGFNQNLQKKIEAQTDLVRKAYEVEKQAREELEFLDYSRNQFILSTQHHFRTPLTVIKGYLGVIAETVPGDSEENKKVKEVIDDTITTHAVIAEKVNQLLLNS